MNKKVLVISSSPRKGGNSDLLCDQFILGANETGNKTEKIFLNNMKINYCTGCGACNNGSKPCAQKDDDAAEIVQKMIDADVIVMATPVYFYTVCAQMKTLIDRTCARYREITNKDFYFIVTAADTIELMGRTIECFRGFTSCLDGATEKGIIYGTEVWLKGEIRKSPAMKEAYEMGKKV